MNPNDDEIRRILETARTLAVVGASGNPEKPSHAIPAMMKREGYRVIPVNPREKELFGEKVRASLDEVGAEDSVDIVDVFRPADETPQIARQAVKLGARVLWLQLGIANDEAARIAREGGLTVVMDRCIGATHRAMGIASRAGG